MVSLRMSKLKHELSTSHIPRARKKTENIKSPDFNVITQHAKWNESVGKITKNNRKLLSFTQITELFISWK